MKETNVRQRKFRWFFLGIAACCFAGSMAACARVGRNFDSGLVSSITIGNSKRSDIRDLLGTPFRVGLDDGDPTWTYVYNRWSAFSPTISKDLTIRFNKDGTVTSYTYNTNYSPGKE